ncbi:hypothetical protein IMG5_187300 [Ichthyophthirius multifiliis]|uniref:60S ribosomal protein L21 n=1 Tax=Ichthyophthirius multifiliis TaxID=5932 RepID=G0R3R9_ICHMU|nr:hypothetical protein IMG5_187300 [Ichthyophthirius multifiliis]EGR27886.1 hypothetical protein IMG5_187300 [Ichthyophthirius multifiliis]|eukprot:XP_004027231.1 hypothetical protein IMG5_187300 [Ichthyophthirius multifiliis]
MTHSYGYRRQTRKKFAKAFKTKGHLRISRYLTTYKIGEYVDILVDGSAHKGMPYKLYHGRTGRVFNVNPRSVGVIVHRKWNGRYIEKRINVKIEHIRPSNVRIALAKRYQENDKRKQEGNKSGKKISTKRQPEQPHEEVHVKGTVNFQHPKVFREVF